MKVILKCEVQRWNAQNNINAKYLYTCSSFSVHLFTHLNVMGHTNTLQKKKKFNLLFPDGNRIEFDGISIKLLLF